MPTVHLDNRPLPSVAKSSRKATSPNNVSKNGSLSKTSIVLPIPSARLPLSLTSPASSTCSASLTSSTSFTSLTSSASSASLTSLRSPTSSLSSTTSNSCSRSTLISSSNSLTSSTSFTSLTSSASSASLTSLRSPTSSVSSTTSNSSSRSTLISSSNSIVASPKLYSLHSKSNMDWIEQARVTDPKNFVGRQKQWAMLTRWLSDRTKPIVILEGLPGTGKTTMAHCLLAQYEVTEVNASDDRGFEYTRDVLKRMHVKKIGDDKKKRAILFDEIDGALCANEEHKSSINAILDYLEETKEPIPIVATCNDYYARALKPLYNSMLRVTFYTLYHNNMMDLMYRYRNMFRLTMSLKDIGFVIADANGDARRLLHNMQLLSLCKPKDKPQDKPNDNKEKHVEQEENEHQESNFFKLVQSGFVKPGLTRVAQDIWASYNAFGYELVFENYANDEKTSLNVRSDLLQSFEYLPRLRYLKDTQETSIATTIFAQDLLAFGIASNWDSTKNFNKVNPRFYEVARRSECKVWFFKDRKNLKKKIANNIAK